MNLDDTLAALAADPCAPVDLARLALAVAADEYPALDAGVYLARLDSLAAALAPRLTGSLESRVAALSAFLFDEQAFTGNAPRYYDAVNSYLNAVLDRKLGIPLTLSLVAMAVGERCGLTVVGVGLPGHFVAKATDGATEVIFDPFHGGQFLDPDDCACLVEAVAGVAFDPTPANLAAATPGAIVCRLLSNLKAVYANAGDYRRAARVVGRLAQLAPTDLDQRRDLGVLLARAGQSGQAIDSLEAYLAARPDGDDVPAVRAFLREARGRVAAWN